MAFPARRAQGVLLVLMAHPGRRARAVLPAPKAKTAQSAQSGRKVSQGPPAIPGSLAPVVPQAQLVPQVPLALLAQPV